MMGNINRILVLVITLFVFSVFSTPNHKRDESNGFFTPFAPLEPTPNPVTRYYEVELAKVNLAPDGLLTEVYAINGQYPGTIIHANKGDRIYATVKNKLGVPSVIHWHGMYQRGSNWYDGVSGQTQCPVPNDASFVYDFSTGDQYGTYWYHAHTHGQYMEGIRAPLIVHDPNDPFRKDYDLEYVITMSDWYHQSITELLSKRMAPGYTGLNPVPDSGLISGVGRYNCSAAPNSECQENNPLAVYKVTPGKRYRLRLINTSGYAHYIFSVDNHPLKIIEADGQYTKPVTVNRLPIAIAQRYSVIIEASQQVANYWMRATIDDRCIGRDNDTLNYDSAINFNVTGILRYDGAPESDYPNSEEYTDNLDPCLSLDQSLLKTLESQQVPGPVTDKIQLSITFGADDKNVTRSFINNSTFSVDDYNPTLVKLVDGKVALNQFPTNQNIYSYDNSGGTVEVTVFNRNNAVHPMHIHGHAFYVLGTGQGDVVDESKLNLVDPFPRDTFVVNSTSWTVFRYKTDNPGIWSIHCHIEWHVEMGMVAQIVELPTELSKVDIPDSVTDLCKQQSNSKRSRFSRRNRLKMERIKV